jgi:Na+/H+ antiporter NhaD/arsenite permease-like protein
MNVVKELMMVRILRVGAFLVSILLCAHTASIGAEGSNAAGPSDILVVSGTISNAQGKGIKNVELSFFLDGKKVELGEDVTTSNRGTYEVRLTFPPGTLPGAKVGMEAARPSYKASGPVNLDKVVKEQVDEKGNAAYLARVSLTLNRTTSPAFWIATLVLFMVYVLIAFEVMHRTLAALLGGAILLFVTYTVGTFNKAYTILTFEDAMKAIDMNVIFLLMALMIIVGVLKKTGVFQWIAYKAFQLARGNVYALCGALMFLTAFISAFLDNVTTMLLVFPVTFEICQTLKIHPVTVLVPCAFGSNVGGTATLIGDPPNIMIGSYAKLTFIDFVNNLTLICLIGMVAAIIYFVFWNKKEYAKAQVGDVQHTIAHLREEYGITDRKLLIQGGIVLGITILLFIIHGALHMEPSIAALVGASILLVWSRVNIVEMLEKEIEWPTLIFFMMLFVVVAGAEETGLIQIIADWVKNVSGGSLIVATLMILWVSALLSAIIDNIPFTATMLPIVAFLTGQIPGAQGGILWWALSLGACLGGNGTMIGASANVVTVGMLEKAGYPVSFMEYLKIAFIPMLITVALCMGWLLIVAM